MLSTGEPEADALLPTLAEGITAALTPQPGLLGIYLYGSLVSGDFTPGVSDIDLLAVTNGPVTPEVIARLRPMHEVIVQRFPAWRDRVEVIYAPRQALATFRTQFSDIGVISPGEPLHIVSAGSDWLMNWHQVRHGGRVVTGPPAETYVPDTTLREYVTAVRDHAAAFGEWMPEMRAPRQQSYAVLTLSRALYTTHHGHGGSKAAAAAWLAAAQPRYAPLLERALRWREVEPDDPAAAERTYPETRRFVREMQAEIASGQASSAHVRGSDETVR
ncbi:MAG: DUF4111 domain-containing protein [Thermomicrobiales bacterium]|nr:DUF4111 domain-containing protein [Thermomicrobiales bacterium]